MTRKRGLGKAFESALQKKEERRPGKRARSILSNPTRQQIYEYLTLHPCAYLSLISKDMLTSIHTLEWHLKKLQEGGYVREDRIGGYRIYFPVNLVESEDIHPLHLLNRENHRLIFSCIMYHPGMSMKDCASTCDISVSSAVTAISDLKADNLITSVEDGRFRRFFPSDRIQGLIERSDAREEAFLKWLLEKMAAEGLEPETVKKETPIAIISVKYRGAAGSLTVGLNPWRTVLKSLS